MCLCLRLGIFVQGRVFDFVRHDNDRMSLEALAVQYRNRFSARAVVISRAQLKSTHHRWHVWGCEEVHFGLWTLLFGESVRILCLKKR